MDSPSVLATRITAKRRTRRGEAGTRLAGLDFASECPSHSNRVFATRSPPAVWHRCFVQLLPPPRQFSPAPAATRCAAGHTAKSRPDFDGSRSTCRRRAGLVPWPGCRATLTEFRHRISPDIGFCRNARLPPSTRSNAQALLHLREKEIEVAASRL
ncbi:hypothetical protein OF846_003731 [Rhodotorula toruloides]|nr:hypothetical protein OF846_003731 [Rhodotorula toruloides]